MRVRNIASIFLIAVFLSGAALFAAGLYRLPGTHELGERYRAAGMPARLADINPNLIVALNAEQPRLSYEFARHECASSERRALARHSTTAVCAISASIAFSDESLRLWWLNSNYFGRGAYGVLGAAQSWYGKEQRDLTLAEAALLIALTRSPSSANTRLPRMLDRLAERLQIPEDARRQAIDGIVADR